MSCSLVIISLQQDLSISEKASAGVSFSPMHTAMIACFEKLLSSLDLILVSVVSDTLLSIDSLVLDIFFSFMMSVSDSEKDPGSSPSFLDNLPESLMISSSPPL